MTKMFSPKEYPFIGFIFGLPTVLFASFRNGMELRATHPEILRTVKIFMGIFLGLFALMVLADIANIYQYVTQARQFVSSSTYGYSMSGYLDAQSGADRLIRSFRNREQMITWIFVIVQYVTLLIFVSQTKKTEVAAYESLKASGQLAPRSNAWFVLFGVGVWVAFWLYGLVMTEYVQSIVGQAL